MLKNNNKLDAGYTALPTEKGNLLKVDIPFKKNSGNWLPQDYQVN